ncbi:heavy metal-responsive transcriptional regulator [Amycolatopsis keratiniphila]|uniref:heavy metal-responsive transcriptional regulator n=1 Tax=Amycolatopsis keratiniphila TaxID=129921 RepID=UPI000879BB7A|nr:heavy metal-responsive transcriptional regulator [Amycolatopsis keratiniphila]OLZ51565.1 heavy metal-responsive transcriptional regulator [Amycolatopsis keratiniphila subsp. nogabecina]SDU11617.1 DNA-binding transcriptional regulator, MerR family [Amycolatopsis keratiniphila]
MRIGELARTAAVSTKTIRYYEQAGLLPEPPRTSSGYRDYGPATVHRLAFIRTAQTAGLSLTEIRDILVIRDTGQAPCDHVGELIDRHLGNVRRRIADLRATEHDLHQLKTRASTYTAASCTSTTVCGIFTR